MPGNIDPAAAVSSFRSQRGLLLNLIRHSLSTLANSLYAQRIISHEVYEKACNENKGTSERCTTLLECVEDRIRVRPSYFNKVVNILESDPFLEDLAEELVQSYRELVADRYRRLMICACVFSSQGHTVRLQLMNVPELFPLPSPTTAPT